LSERCPDPPDRLPQPRRAELRELQARLTRIYARSGPHPMLWTQWRFYGPIPAGRFDHHLEPRREQGRGILYACIASEGVSGLEAAIAETFQDSRFIERFDRERWAVIWTPERPLTLLDLDSHWTTRAGGSRALTAGSRKVSQRWALAIYEQLEDIDGLTWRSSVVGHGRCVALWERATDSLPEHPGFNRALLDHLEEIAERIGYEIL